MNKKVFVFDFGLFILEELLLLLLHFVIPDHNDSKPLIYGITISLFLCVAVSSIFFNKYIKKTKISVNDAVCAFSLVALAAIIYFVIYYDPIFPFSGIQGTVFIGITMTIGCHGLLYCKMYFSEKSKEFGFGYKAKEYYYISEFFEKTAIIAAIGTIIIVIVRTFT